jgi:RNA polymerase sigma-70 factor, ECF subfamily
VQEEESLVRRAKEYDQAALTKLYEDNFDKVYRYAVIRIGDRAEAEDITQQVFTNALKSISSYKMKGVPFSAWLYRIAHNLIVDRARKKARQYTVPLDESLTMGSDDPVKQTESKLQVEELVTVMQKLTKAQQEVISLRFVAEMPIAQVAKAMGKTEGAIKALQHSAISALRRAMVST